MSQMSQDFAAPSASKRAVPAPLLVLLAVFGLTALLALVLGARLGTRGQWLPDAPNSINEVWTATDVPLDDLNLVRLGQPRVVSRRYANPFEEVVNVQVIAPETTEAFHEPPFTGPGYGFTVSAQKDLPLFGPGKSVSATVLKGRAANNRVLMYYWTQDQAGSTDTRNSLPTFPAFLLDYKTRLLIGLDALKPRQLCVVRVYTQIHPADEGGRQARRNMDAVARGLHDAFAAQKGASGSGGVAVATGKAGQ